MQDKLIEILEDILEENDINANFELNEDNWDSLNVISFIAAINSNFQLVLAAEDISKAATIGELIYLIEQTK